MVGCQEIAVRVQSKRSDAADKRFDLQYFWMTDTLYDPDGSDAWLTIKQEIVDRIAPLGNASKKFQWGIITFRPEKLRNSKNQIEEWVIERRRMEEELARRKEELENKNELDASYENGDDSDKIEEDDE